MEIKVSVIVPVYKVQKYLSRCMESLINQTLKDIEIILIDDGSPDQCPELCDEYARKYNNIKVIHQKNAGLGMARNAGLEIAQGIYIAFVDSDDYLDKRALENLYEIADKNSADTVLGAYYREDNEGNIIKGQEPIKNKVFEGKENIKKNVLANMLGSPKEYHDDIYLMMAVWMGLYSNKIIQENKIRFCSERQFISEDIIFDMDYYPFTKKVIISDKPYYYYCENGDSLTLSYKEDRFEKNKILFEEIERRGEILELDISERLDRSFIGRARQCIYSEVKYNKYLKARNNIKKICNDDYLRTRLNRYDIKYLSLKQKLFLLLMKKKFICWMYIICKIYK